VNIDLKKGVVGIHCDSAKEKDIKTSQCSPGMDGNHLTMENKPQQYIQIEKLFYIDSIVSTFCT